MARPRKKTEKPSRKRTQTKARNMPLSDRDWLDVPMSMLVLLVTAERAAAHASMAKQHAADLTSYKRENQKARLEAEKARQESERASAWASLAVRVATAAVSTVCSAVGATDQAVASKVPQLSGDTRAALTAVTALASAITSDDDDD